MTLAPDYYDRERATALIEALDAEGLEIRPKTEDHEHEWFQQRADMNAPYVCMICGVPREPCV